MRRGLLAAGLPVFIYFFGFPKNLESRTGPSSSLSLPLCLDLDLYFLSFFVLFDLDRDLDFLESLSSSSLLDDSDDELELDSDELLCFLLFLLRFFASLSFFSFLEDDDFDLEWFLPRASFCALSASS